MYIDQFISINCYSGFYEKGPAERQNKLKPIIKMCYDNLYVFNSWQHFPAPHITLTVFRLVCKSQSRQGTARNAKVP
jgi:hypothetical protein